jgi:hypothetical protein
MKRLMILFALSIGLALNLTAQRSGNDSPASREDVEKYMQVAHASDMMKQIMHAMSKPMHDMIHQQAMKDQDKLPPDFEVHMNQIVDDMMNTMPFDEMLQAMVPVYQKHFTHADLESLTAFYSTPVGQKILHEMPEISAETMQSMMPIMQKQMAAMQQRVRQEVAQAVKVPQK